MDLFWSSLLSQLLSLSVYLITTRQSKTGLRQPQARRQRLITAGRSSLRSRLCQAKRRDVEKGIEEVRTGLHDMAGLSHDKTGECSSDYSGGGSLLVYAR